MTGLTEVVMNLPNPSAFNEQNILALVEKLKLDGKASETQYSTQKNLRYMARHFDLDNPNQAKKWLAETKLKPNTKHQLLAHMKTYYDYMHIEWEAPTNYKSVETIHYIPPEEHLDLLIASAGKETATFMQMAKETAGRVGELTQIEWTDIDTTRKLIEINHPEKHSHPRTLPISNRLIEMLSNLPKKYKTIFNPRKASIRQIFTDTRNLTAKRTANPDLLKIHLHTFRHWKATMLYHETHDIYEVKRFLGHKSVKNTEIYITIEKDLWMTTNDQWTSTVTHTLEEEQKAINIGFELVRAINETTALYRKRK